MSEAWSWWALAALGAYHGLNPAMGWLFAAARGFQTRRLGAVFASLGPIAAGHLLSVAAVVLAVGAAGVVVPLDGLRVACAAVLVGIGVYRLVRPRAHPRGGGMRLSAAGLTVWSFLMSSAHGAGLMLLPLLVGGSTGQAHDHGSLHAVVSPASPAASIAAGAAAVGLHSAAMLLTMAAIAAVVYLRVGTAILRSAWINLDLLWAGALIVAGLVTLVV